MQVATTKYTTVQIPVLLHRKLKLRAVQADIPMARLVENLLTSALSITGEQHRKLSGVKP